MHFTVEGKHSQRQRLPVSTWENSLEHRHKKAIFCCVVYEQLTTTILKFLVLKYNFQSKATKKERRFMKLVFFFFFFYNVICALIYLTKLIECPPVAEM